MKKTDKVDYHEFCAILVGKRELAELVESSEGLITLGTRTDHKGEVLICTQKDIVGIGEIEECLKGVAGYGYTIKNFRKVVEMPIFVRGEVFTIDLPSDIITEYPENVVIDDQGWKIIQKKINKNNLIRRIIRYIINL